MKRILTVLVTLALLAAMAGTAVAEYNEPILFRNIPWGSLKSDVSKQMPTPKDILRVKMPENLFDLDWYMNGTLSKAIKGNARFYQTYIYDDGSLKVAGYTVDNVCMHYAYSVIDGIPDYSIINGRLFAAEYEIIPIDEKTVHDDLICKLTDLYGDPDYKSYKHGVSIDYTYTTWKGKNGTSVTLILAEYTLSPCHIYIRYVTQEGIDMQNEVLEANKKLEAVSAANDTSGL